jgi:hypothetical protein
MLATISTLQGWSIIVGAWFLLWVVPAIVVSGVGAGEGFRPLGVFMAALFLSWPLVLLVVIVLGGQSPLVLALRSPAQSADL